jgi:hypothetical protein
MVAVIDEIKRERKQQIGYSLNRSIGRFNCDNEKSKRKSPESTQQQHLLTFNREKESVVIIVIGIFCV